MEKINCSNSKPVHDKRKRIGIIFLVIGLVFLARNLHFFPFPMASYLFSWPMLLVFIGLSMVIFNRRNVGGVFMIAIGGLFLLDKITPLTHYQWQLAWPGVFIFVGIFLVIGYLTKPAITNKQEQVKNKDKKGKYDEVEFDIDKIEPVEY